MNLGEVPISDLNAFMVINDNIAPVIVRGKGAELEDEDGKRYVDLEAGPGAAAVGHCHPRVIAAIRDQAGKLIQGPGKYYSRLTMSLAKRISDLTNGALRRTFFVNSGAESVDGAIKLAMKHATNKGRKGYSIIALQHGFHGRTGLPIALTGIAKQKRGFGPYGTFPGVVHAPAPYCYRCPFDLRPSSCKMRCAQAVEDMLGTAVQGEAAVFIGEPILGVGGAIVPPQDYWPKIEEICRRHGIVFITDEVFTGFGRTGSNFAHQAFGVKPDIMTFAKAIGGGVPLGGFIATEELGTAFAESDHSTTFGGRSQIGVAAGHAVLDILKQEALADNAKERGEQFLAGLRSLAKKHPTIGDVRGMGLMIGFEIVRPGSKIPDAAKAKTIARELASEGIIISPTGVFANTLRITPPLVITPNQVEFSLAAFDKVLCKVEQT